MAAFVLLSSGRVAVAVTRARWPCSAAWPSPLPSFVFVLAATMAACAAGVANAVVRKDHESEFMGAGEIFTTENVSEFIAAVGEFSFGCYESEIAGILKTDRLEKSLFVGTKETDSGVCVSEGFRPILLEVLGQLDHRKKVTNLGEENQDTRPSKTLLFHHTFRHFFTV